MTRAHTYRHEFVEVVPDVPAEGVVYVSMRFATAVHLCPCGCRSEIVTPLTPTDWCLFFDGVSVSLRPSVGSWGLPCRSHYWLVRGQVRWSRPMSEAQIQRGRERDAATKARYYRELLDPDGRGRS